MKLPPRMDLGRFKGAISKGVSVPGPVLLHKSASVKIEGAGERRKMFTISTGTVDRDNDTLALDGWDLKAYMTNPVVLWGHDSSSPPIGRSVEIGTDGEALKAVVEFVPGDMPLVGEMAEMVFRMTDLGFLSACSVGFRPLEYDMAKDRMDDEDMWWPAIDFTKQELLEWSVCTIPSNPEATVDRVEERATFVAERKAVDEAAAALANIQAIEIANRRRMLRAACY